MEPAEVPLQTAMQNWRRVRLFGNTNQSKSMKRVLRGGFVLVSGLVLVGCASVDSRNADSRPWNRPPPPEMNTSCWPWWPGWLYPSVYEEQQWLHSQQNFGRW